MSIATDVREPATASGSDREPVEQALAEAAAGRTVVVVGREHGSLVLPAHVATGEAVGYLIRHTSGLLAVPMAGWDLERLRLPPMVTHPSEPGSPDYTVPVDAVHAGDAGSSPRDRARTLRVLADSRTTPAQLRRPGHVQPTRVAEHGLLQRSGAAEAAFDLTRMAGVPAVSAVAELVGPDGVVLSASAAVRFAAEHGLASVAIDELTAYRQRHERQVERVTEARLPTAHGEFRAVGYRYTVDGTEHVALVHGDIRDAGHALVRVHRECPGGAPFRSLRCDCRARLDAAMEAAVTAGSGLVVYVRAAPRREPVRSARDDVVAGQILADLGVPAGRAAPPVANAAHDRPGCFGGPAAAH